MAGKSRTGFQAELPGHSGCCKEGSSVQSDHRSMGWINSPCARGSGGMCFNVQGKVGEDEGNFSKVVGQVVGNCS